MPRERTYKKITFDNIDSVLNDGERIFATACLRKNLQVYQTIPVETSNIDFLVKNPRNLASEGKLVEVTWTGREELAHILKHPRLHKSKQVNNLRKSGMPWTVVTGESLRELQRREKSVA